MALQGVVEHGREEDQRHQPGHGAGGDHGAGVHLDGRNVRPFGGHDPNLVEGGGRRGRRHHGRMRLFAAVRPPGPVAEVVGGAVRQALTRPGCPPARPVPPEQLHITLAFYGEVTPAVVPDLSRRLERAAARTPAVPVVLAGAGAFPRAARAQVLWVAVEGDLALLAARCQAAGRRTGIAREERRWRAHLTVARVRVPADARCFVEALAGLRTDQWTAGELQLVRSRLGATVAHEVIGAWPLPPAA